MIECNALGRQSYRGQYHGQGDQTDTGDTGSTDGSDRRGGNDSSNGSRGQRNTVSLCYENNCYALHDGSTVHVNGGTQRNRKGRNLFGDTDFLYRVSIDRGIVALLVEVEKAKVITGKNF